MTTDTKYNGWTNYETWLAALWMDNDGGDYWSEVAQECYNDAETDDTFTRIERATFSLADRIKDQHKEYASEWMKDQSSFFSDLINSGLSSKKERRTRDDPPSPVA